MFDERSFDTRSFSPSSWSFGAIVQAVGKYLRAVRATIRIGIYAALARTATMRSTTRRKAND